MNSPRCIAAQNGCTTSETMRLLNSINNTPISECCDDRANRRMGICDADALLRALQGKPAQRSVAGGGSGAGLPAAITA
jgi:hypothetical protein